MGIKEYVQKFFWDYLYNHAMVRQLVESLLYNQKKEILHDLFARVSFEEMKKFIEEAEKDQEHKYFILAELISKNYR